MLFMHKPEKQMIFKMFLRAGDTINFSLPSTFIQFISSWRVSCIQSLSVSSCCWVRICGWLWLFWSQGIGRDYNEILHRPLKAQMTAFAKMEIHLLGKPSHTQTLLHLPVLLVSLLQIRRKSGLWSQPAVTSCFGMWCCLFWHCRYI